jgi:hypothetical protein
MFELKRKELGKERERGIFFVCESYIKEIVIKIDS